MLHARIAARAFNTPLLVEPSKAMAFLSGLGPRILGRRIEMLDGALDEGTSAAALPARASILAGGLPEPMIVVKSRFTMTRKGAQGNSEQ